MKCFACNKTVPEETVVCPFCETVLDVSLIESAPPPDDGDDEPAPAPPPRRKPAPRPPSRPAAPAVKRKPAVKRAPAPPPEKKADWRDELSQEDWGEQKEAVKFEPNRTFDPNEGMSSAVKYIFQLALADKLALFGTAVLLMSTFFPWKETVTDGEVLGVMSMGLVVTVLSAIGIVGIVIRTRKPDPKLNPILPWIAQLGAIGFSGVWCLVALVISIDSTTVMSTIGNYETWVSKPSFGLILAILSAIVAVVGTIFGLRDMGPNR